MNLVHKCIALGLAIFSLLTLGLFVATPSAEDHLEIDSGGYERTATHFAATSDLIDPATPTCHPVQTLTYPLFVGMIYKIFGHSYGWVVLMQMLLAMLCGVMIFFTTQRLFGSSVACIAFLLWSVNLGFLVYVQFLMTEIVLVTFLIAFINRMVLFWQTRQSLNLYAAGFLLGCSVIVKPAGLFFIIPLSIVLLFFVAGSIVQRLLYVAFVTCAFAVPVIGYMTRNKVRFGHFAIAPMSNEILYRYFSAKVKAKLENKVYEDILQEEAWCTADDLLDTAGWQASKEYLVSAVKQHPLVIMQLWITNVLKTWLGLFSTQLKVLLDQTIHGGDCSFFKMPGTTISKKAYQYITCGQLKWLNGIAGLEAVWTLVRYLFVMLALGMLLQTGNYFWFSFCVMYLAYFTAVTGHDGCCRYRMMIEPILIILIAYGMHTLTKIYGMLRKNY